MPARPITSPSSRSALPKPSMYGPSCTRRTSVTRPRRVPSPSTTADPLASLISIVPPRGDVADDVIAHPVLGGDRRQGRLLERDGDGAADVGHVADGDA